MRGWLAVLMFLLGLPAAGLATPAADTVVLDPLDDLAPWSADASEGVDARLAIVPGMTGAAVRLAWDFNDVSGYAFLRRALAVDLPDNFVLRFRARWTGGANAFEFKLLDEGGENVWWVRRPDYRPADDGWQTITVRRRDIDFAWGPTTDKTLRRVASIEFVVARGRDGGAGTLDLDELTIEPLPVVATVLPPPVAAAVDGQPSAALDGDPATVWRGHGPLTIDFSGAKEFGGAVLTFEAAPTPRSYSVETSDGAGWTVRRRVADAEGTTDFVALPESEARFLRIVPDGTLALAEVAVQPPDWAATPNNLLKAAAAMAPRGHYPRGFVGEQGYWTLVGTDGGVQSALIGEDGAVEVAKGGFSIVPLLFVGGQRFDWANVTATQRLVDGYLPVPQVEWRATGWRLTITAFADPEVPGGRLMLRYRLANTGTAPLDASLVLGVVPIQVNPPSQFLSQAGGVSAIEAIDWDGERLLVTGADRRTEVRPLTAPGEVVAQRFDASRAQPPLGQGSTGVRDETGLASAALRYGASINPLQEKDFLLVVPFGGGSEPLDPTAFATTENATLDYWHKRLNSVDFTVPAAKQPLIDTLRTSLAHILMSRSGPELRPGTRSYARSWIRDGAMMAEGLLRLDQIEPVREYLRWYSGFQFESGKVPCCVDFRGADPVPENDSQGEYIHLVAELYRYTGDRSVLEDYWSNVLAAEEYMETLRQSERTGANRTPDRRMLYGLMPPSISHEGYSAKPQYSLWDDFWALTGYRDAAFVAAELGKPEALILAGRTREFRADIHAAISASADHWDIEYIPGATSLGDFDATSTTIALDPGGEQARLRPDLLAGTFERYWQDFVARPDGTKDWSDYTPYELRNVSSFVRLGWRDRVDDLLEYLMADRRPRGWNQWAEVVGRDPREVRFIGDMPHAWISSDYIRAILDLFAYARSDDGALVLGAGLDPEFFTGEGSSVAGMLTPYGTLDLTMAGSADDWRVTVAGDAAPPGGFVLTWPFDGSPGATMVDGKSVRWQGRALPLTRTGSPILIEVGR